MGRIEGPALAVFLTRLVSFVCRSSWRRRVGPRAALRFSWTKLTFSERRGEWNSVSVGRILDNRAYTGIPAIG